MEKRGNSLTEKGRLIGASQSEQMFEHILIILNNFRIFREKYELADF